MLQFAPEVSYVALMILIAIFTSFTTASGVWAPAYLPWKANLGHDGGAGHYSGL
jgi:hypothetical protein